MYYIYKNFSKPDKAILRGLTEIAVKKEIASFVKKTLPDYQSIVQTKHPDIREPYWAFYEKIQDFSKHLERRYDGHSHADIPIRVAQFIVEGHLTAKDIAGFSEAGKAKIMSMVEAIRRNSD